MLKQIIENLRYCASDTFECDKCTAGRGNGCEKGLKSKAAFALEAFYDKMVDERWRIAEEENPPKGDEADFYLVVCSGKVGGIRLLGSVEIGEWDCDEGAWSLCWLPAVENLKVYAWRPIPEVTGVIEALLPKIECGGIK